MTTLLKIYEELEIQEEANNIQDRKILVIGLGILEKTCDSFEKILNNYGQSLLKKQVNVTALKENVRRDLLNQVKKIIDGINGL